MNARPFQLGLTGGIGSGKSTVAAFLQEFGATLIDADAISRGLTAAGGQAVETIAREFGKDFVTAQGAMDRDLMRQLAFSDATAKKRLEAILHPLVGIEIGRQASDATTSGSPCLVFDIPLLVESSHWRQRLDKVLVIDCSPALQIERVRARNGLTAAAVEGIISVQASRPARLAAADYVLCNDGLSLEGLQRKARLLWIGFGLSSRTDSAHAADHRNSL